MSEQDEHLEVQAQILPGVTPGAMLDAMEDPESFASIARADLYVSMARMRQRAAHPEFSATHLLEYSKFLARMGKVDAPDKTGLSPDNMPRIEIILPNSGATVQIGGYNPSEREISIEDDVGELYDDMELADDDDMDAEGSEDEDNGFALSGKPSIAVLP